ncbi:ribosomal protein P0 (A0) (L10E) [Friedmanniomyces endolithicus]|nr:ribosomal protein P0 (A0) (L10E) [Friedmanniomyces endolithicus]
MRASIMNITKISLAAGYPTLPSVMHSMLNSHKNLLAIAVETEYEWPAISQLKAVIKDPSLAQSSAPAASAPADAPAAEAPKEEEKKEDEEEEDEDMGFVVESSLFVDPTAPLQPCNSHTQGNGINVQFR